MEGEIGRRDNVGRWGKWEKRGERKKKKEKKISKKREEKKIIIIIKYTKKK